LVTPSFDHSNSRPLSGQLVVFTGKLSSLGRKDACALVARLGGATGDDISARTTMVVVGAEGFGPAPQDKSHKLKRAEELHIRIVSEEEFCRIADLPTPDALKRQYHALRDLVGRYPLVREDHLRYLIKCGVLHPVTRTNADIFFAFPDVAIVRQAHEALAEGAAFRAVVRSLIAARQGQLELDFRLDAAPARVIALRRPAPTATPPSRFETARQDTAKAEEFFRAASELDDGTEGSREAAAATYRKALERDPYLVPALINLANIHYSRDELVEAQALYERAIGLESDFFEAHFNLGNIYHDLGRFGEAQACYREAVRLNPHYADAHFYLAVTLEKMGSSAEARPHWRAYRELAPQGEWVELAKEFSD
jgi:tetratricopeptide (TPR) repeat protein